MMRSDMDSIRTRRERLGISQEEAARKAGVSLATWRRFENGDGTTAPRRATTEAIERALQPDPVDDDAHPWIRWIEWDLDNFYDVTDSNGREYLCVKLESHHSIVHAYKAAHILVAAIHPDHVVSIGISADTWEDED